MIRRCDKHYCTHSFLKVILTEHTVNAHCLDSDMHADIGFPPNDY